MSTNIFKKLQEARVKFQAMDVKKSGRNTHSNYDYYELNDILPPINKINEEIGLCPTISFGIETASMTIINTDNPEDKAIFTTPMSTASLRACHEVQNLGAVQTYLRRYLYICAYEISEGDVLDETHGKGKTMKTDNKDARAVTLTAETITKLAEQKGVLVADICKKNSVTEIKFLKQDIKKKVYEALIKLPDKK